MGRFKEQEKARLYEQQMGAEAAQRQRLAATKLQGGCICGGITLKKRWDGIHLSERRIHQSWCPKWRWWMEEVGKLKSSD
jgi:hypothetical protein